MNVAPIQLGLAGRLRVAARIALGLEPQRNVDRAVSLMSFRDRIAWAGRILAGGAL